MSSYLKSENNHRHCSRSQKSCISKDSFPTHVPRLTNSILNSTICRSLSSKQPTRHGEILPHRTAICFLLTNYLTEILHSLRDGGYMSPRRGKNDDKAHPPIHPTAHANDLTGDEKRVYEYIARRYLACCSKDAEGWQTTVDIICGGEEFQASGICGHFVVHNERFYVTKYRFGHKGEELSDGLRLRQMDGTFSTRVCRRRGVRAYCVRNTAWRNVQTKLSHRRRSRYSHG